MRRYKFQLEDALEPRPSSAGDRLRAWARRKWVNFRKERVRFKMDRMKAFELNGYAEQAGVAFPVMVEAAVLASLESPTGMIRMVGSNNRPVLLDAQDGMSPPGEAVQRP